jgi:hypothetical protein
LQLWKHTTRLYRQEVVMKRALLLVPMLTMLFSMGCAVRARYYGPDRYRDSRYYDRDHRYYHHDRDDYRRDRWR